MNIKTEIDHFETKKNLEAVVDEWAKIEIVGNLSISLIIPQTYFS